MNRTESMTREAALVLARNAQAQQQHDPEFGPPEPDPTPWLSLAAEIVDAALAEHLAREGDVYRPDVELLATMKAQVVALKAERDALLAQVAELKAHPVSRYRVTVNGEGSAA